LTDQESDAVELPLEVIPAGLQKTTGKALALSNENDEQIFEVNLPANAHATARSFKLEAAPSLAGTLFGALDYLTGFPYGCTEQTMSRFMPNMVVTQALNDIKGASIRKDNNLPAKVKRGIDKLSGLQHDDGGWGWWKDDKTDPFMTAYVIDGLSQAVKAGYGVESFRIEQGREALKKMIEAHKAEDGHPIDADTNSYAIFAYVGSGEGGEKYLNELFAQRATLQPYGRAMLALALHSRNDKRAGQVAADIEKSAKVSEYDAHWESEQAVWYGKQRLDLEATAYSLKALARITPTSQILNRAARWIVANKTNGYGWMSTKHSSFAINGLIDYLKVSNELDPDYTIEVYLNGEQIHSRHVTSAETQPFTFERKGATLAGNNQIRIVKRGRGVAYFASTLEFFSREETTVAQTSNNLKLTREYMRLLVKDDGSGKPSWTVEPLTGEVRSGDYIVSKLHLTGASARQVMIEDPIPAGCEQINSVSGINLNYNENNWCSWYSSREFRDNRTALFLDYFDGDDTFQYAMRVQIPGDFKIGPARAELMYQRNIQANTASAKQKILDKK
jgi:alpha-2-macroglobulin